jgi:plasmid maintenance system killer protein
LEVTFRTRKLEKEYREFAKAKKAYGDQVGRRFILRINTIKHVRDIEELKLLPGLRCHGLKGNRHGQYAVTLIGRWRLIFTLQGDALEIVHIEEVSKHYGD